MAASDRCLPRYGDLTLSGAESRGDDADDQDSTQLRVVHEYGRHHDLKVPFKAPRDGPSLGFIINHFISVLPVLFCPLPSQLLLGLLVLDFLAVS
nr:hypothetical protein CFP56_41334 [Quercus suber]